MLAQAPAIPSEIKAYLRAKARRMYEEHAETLARARAEDRPVSEAETAAQNRRVREATADEWTWLRNYTKTYNPHWIEEGRPSPREPFPDKPYFSVLFEFLRAKGRVKPIKKSRDMMVTWAIMGYFTLEAMKVPEREIVVQTMKTEKVVQCIDYAKCLYDSQPEWLKAAFPVSKPTDKMASNEFSLANGSIIFGVPGGADQMRSYHPWGYFNDETAFQTEAGLCYDEALSACQKIVLNSTAADSWFFDWMDDVELK